ncbi:hypothetical protein Bpfe_031066 [Biomphalaria pfeifferi]|uniref:Uncharacterized protein n=1 Tax=Biomphalaria pfeifferi TaxID=112525 RepID=A0AAD8ANH6_BIOPF|nr:hypothetical protein Bpfe_031066 [Biomphalaria pfeifferi]
MVVKSTVAEDEHPDLFRALASMRDLRRRSSRLRDLAMKGLLFEKGVAVGEVARAEAKAEANARGASQPKVDALGGGSVEEQLNWGS